MSKWAKTYGEVGILRKNDTSEKIEDLLVFGYACKLFRDDEKALEIDQGKHLIPWMADETLKIDRYDGRAALADLSQYEATTEGYDTARWLGLTDSERRVEQLCDEERYRSLHTNEDEDEMYREEELKRLHQQLSNEKNYGQVSYSYDSEEKQTGKEQVSSDTAGDNEPFIPPPDLDLPINMKIPETAKQNARIEKTALFISQHGAQMEILLKAKQAANPQFYFLSQEDVLYPYYRHILMAIKMGRFRPQTVPIKNETEPQENDEYYLHPSLVPITSKVESAPSIPNISYKPSADCAYTMLISKIKGSKPQIDDKKTEPIAGVQTTINNSIPAAANSAQMYVFPPNSTYVYNYTTGKYEPQAYSQVMPNYTQSSNGNTESGSQKQYYGDPAQYAAYMKTYEQQQALVASYYATGIAKTPVIYTKSEEVISAPQSQSNVTTSVKEKPKPLLPIAHYSSDSESENDETEDANESKVIINVPNYVIPPSDIQLIIDKMASYVARNGQDFEMIVKAKGDTRFSFLDKSHVFHAYYRHKLKTYGAVLEEEETVVKSEEKEISTDNNPDENSDSKVNNVDISVNEVLQEKQTENFKKVIAPVSFSIKKSKENEPVPIEKSALPIEESSEDETELKEVSDINQQKEITYDEEQPVEVTEKVPAHSSPQIEKQPEQIEQVIEIEDSAHELIDLTEDLEEKKDVRKAEDKIKDKLAAAAREKMSLLSRDRALQLERKRRAEAFLSKIQSEKVLNVNGSKSEDTETVNTITEPVASAEEDDLMKRLYNDSGSSNNEDVEEGEIKSVKRKSSRSRSPEKKRHKSKKKKDKPHSSSSSDSPKKHRKRSHHLKDKKSKKKKRSRSRSSSRSHKSWSRSVTTNA